MGYSYFYKAVYGQSLADVPCCNALKRVILISNNAYLKN